MSFHPEKSHTLTLHLSERTVWPTPPIYLLNNPLKEVQSFKLLGLTLSHDLSWANHISKLASKASRRLGTLRHAKAFLCTPELLSTNNAFIRSLMECCSPLWAIVPPPHTWFSLTSSKPIPSKSLESSARKLSLWANHLGIANMLVVSVFFCLLSGLAPSALSVFCPSYPPPPLRLPTRHT